MIGRAVFSSASCGSAMFRIRSLRLAKQATGSYQRCSATRSSRVNYGAEHSMIAACHLGHAADTWCIRSPCYTATRSFTSQSSPEKEIEDKLKQLIREEPVLILIKGSPESPQCGFSATLVKILDTYKVSNYAYIDVNCHDLLKPCAKKISNWPTFPQLYINGNFIGGCDIVKELHNTGELKKLLAGLER